MSQYSLMSVLSILSFLFPISLQAENFDIFRTETVSTNELRTHVIAETPIKKLVMIHGDEIIPIPIVYPEATVLASAVKALSSNVEHWPDRINCLTSVVINGVTTEVCDVTQMYDAWVGLDGILDLYLATGDVFFIDVALSVSEKYKSVGNDEDTDGYLDWFSTNIHDYNDYHYEWRAGAGVARTVSVVLKDQSLNRECSFFKLKCTGNLHNRAKKLLSFAEQHIWDKWYSKGSLLVSGSNQVHVSHFIGRAGLIALYLSKHTEDPLKHSQYIEFVNASGKELKMSLNANTIIVSGKEAYNIRCYTKAQGGSAPYDCASDGLPIEGTIDVSHAGDTVAFIVEAYLTNNVGIFDQQDIKKLSNTVLNLIISTSDQAFRSNVCTNECTNTPPLDPYYNNLGAIQSEWAKLAQFNEELINIYLQWLSNNKIDIKPISSPKVNIKQKFYSNDYILSGIYGNLALAVTRLNNKF